MPGLVLDFAGESLIGQEPPRATTVPDDLSAYAADLPRTPAWPVFQGQGDEICLQLQNDFYFDLEAGLRLRFCRQVPHEAAAEIADTLRRLRAIELPTAYPVYEDEHFRLEVTRLAALKARLGPVRVSVDGDPRGTPLRDAGLAGKLRFASSIVNKTTDEIFLPRRFPGAVAHWIVAEKSLVLLYPLARADDFLAIELRDPSRAGAVAAGLERLPALLERRIRASAVADAAVTEVYFAAQGQAGDEWVEIAAPASDGTLAYTIATENANLRGEFFAFAHTALVLDRAQGLRLNDRLLANGAEEIAYANLVQVGAGRFRSLARAGGNYGFYASVRCYTGALCGSPDIHPDLVRRLPGIERSERACAPEDFHLSELNPFGVATDGRVDPGGKFVEIQALRPCQAGGILFRAGETLLDPGFAFLAAGEILLFAASRDYFDLSESPGVLRFYEETGLRSFGFNDTVLLLDVAGTGVGSPPRTIELYTPPGGPVAFLPESNSGSASSSPSRLHSLLPPNERARWPLFHRAGMAGLRPDLANTHAMSPGRIVATGPEFTEPDAMPGFSEILPAGAYGPNGASLPGAEFIELYFPAGGTPGDETLAIEIEAGDATEVFLVPGPATLPSPFARRAVWSREPTVCWNETNIAFAPALRLPNASSVYTLRSAGGAILDRFAVSQSLYDSLQANAERRSLTKIPDTELWRPSGASAARDHLCGARTAATPAGPASYAPFFAETERSPAYHALRVFSLASGEIVNWRIGPAPDAPLRSGEEFVPSGGILTLSASGLSGPRLLAEARIISVPGTEGIFTGELFPAGQAPYFESIAPTPPGGGQEWLRICARDGFTLAPGDELIIQDGQATDRIVPFAARFTQDPPLPLSGSTLTLPPGRCAILIDPDLNAGTSVYLPVLNVNDASIWTIAASSTIGNGLASGEGLRLLLEHTGTTSALASYGLPDTQTPFGLPSLSGQFVRRTLTTSTGPRYDRPDAWEVAP